ncbi:NACHT, LRR and PYD domains-containing protein 12-like isoform X2 [Colossoma macropomum]|uniref:NACHT, LRR and PYD domains-containing protein 12-like isoform X2 n=1 Tax=Colossoma macropomum TaxID=42526 RepID=UPI0018654F38|nr:NACHT, LRR and PYD domains-containing protein 12-like isoform X2 [Colossoma macropomum]
MANISQVLLDTLQNLGGKDLKLFQWKLTSGVEGFKSIPKALLEDADRLDTVDKMVASYDLSGAVAITLDILKNLNQNQLAEELRINLRESGDICEEVTFKSPAASSTAPQTKYLNSALTADGKQCDIRRTTKTKFKAKLAKLYEGTSFEGDFMPLEYIYTDLYVTEGCTGWVNTEHEVRQVEAFYPKTEETPIKFSDIFKVSCDQKVFGMKVLTVGIAGVGKTVCVQKFILDWAEDSCNQDIDFILFLPFRELNLIKDEQCSLWDLLLYFHDELCGGNVTEILNGRCRMVLILDGLDESRISLNFNQKKVSNVTQKTTLDKLITSLIKGELLPSAIIWITSRPAAASQIPRKYFDHVTEIRGFNDPQKDEYIRKRIRDQHQASRIISHIKTARSLHILCHIPVFCRISVTVLQKMLTEGKDMKNAPTTLTEMYTRFLLFQMMQKSEKYEGQQKEINTVQTRDKQTGALNILKLGRLAFLQLQKGELLFYKNDLKECGIDVDEALVYSGVCTQVFKKDERIFSFVHLSFQEFFAAIFVFLTFSHEFNPLLQTTLEKITWNLKHSLCDLLKTAVNKAMKSKNGHLDLFLRFLFGLSLESNQRLLKSLQLDLKIKEESLKDIVEYIKRKIRKTKSYEKSINLFHCLNEVKDSSLTSEIQKYINSGVLTIQTLSFTQWSALVFVLLISEEAQEMFELKKYRPSDEGLRRLLPVVKNTRRALLDHCNLSKHSNETLASVFSSDSALRELDLSYNDLQDSGVELLCTGLKSSCCKLEILRLAGCNLTLNSCVSLCSTLKSANTLLIELDLSHNDLQDSGLELLSGGLKSSHCKLEILRLDNCNLSKHSCETLASVFSTNSLLRELDLSNNPLYDLGVELLSAGLMSSDCKLEVLRLAGCNLTSNACEMLCSALKSTNSYLMMLDLSNNGIQDLGVDLLSEGLKSSTCKLQILRLSGCSITEAGISSLATALSANPSNLKELDIAYNDPLDKGMKLLSATLEDPHCKLETLRLAVCNLTMGSCRALSSALQSENSSLRELDLSNNDLQDSGVKLLSAGLMSTHCKLETLCLSGCLVTEEGCASLASALSSNPSHLKELDLTYNYPGDSGVKLLSSKLEDPHCKLETLRLEHAGTMWIKLGLRKYAFKLTLDPNTAHAGLSISEENRKVVVVREHQSYPDHPERFDYCKQVLCRESLTGRCYWEVEWSKWTAIAVTYKGISRKGNTDDCRFGFSEKSLRLFCSHIGYSVWHNKKSIAIPVPSSSSNRVGVYLDWSAGTLSFYKVSSDTSTLTHLHTFHSTFTEPIYAGFAVWTNDSSVCLCQIEEPPLSLGKS